MNRNSDGLLKQLLNTLWGDIRKVAISKNIHFFFLRALGSLDHRWWINILMPVCHLAGFAYATIAIIIANELEIQTSFICCGARKLHLQKQILHSHAYNFFRNRTICQHQHRDNSLLIQLKSKPWNRCGMTSTRLTSLP